MAMHKTHGSLAPSPAKSATMSKGSSAPQNTSTGSGSRPEAKGKHPIPTSAPVHPHKLDGRHTPGALR